MAYYEFVHNIGLHSWDIPALIMLVLFGVIALVHKRNQAQREDDFEEELEKKIQEAQGSAVDASK